jgi:hypothetical protein
LHADRELTLSGLQDIAAGEVQRRQQNDAKPEKVHVPCAYKW